MNSLKNALDVLERTSRTFYIPIARLPATLQEAVAAGYLCMRAIDEVEDHPNLDNGTKAQLLRQISYNLQCGRENSYPEDFAVGLEQQENILPEVSLRIGEWALLAPQSIAPRIWDSTAAMADRMAFWAERNWRIRTEADLDSYTFSVAGAVGLLLSDLWAWYDNTKTNRLHAIGFGRGLQSVNILRNHKEDLQRGVNFFPEGWQLEQMYRYARGNLALADAYNQSLANGPALDFCSIPLILAYGTLDALEKGKEKLTRSEVLFLLQSVSA